MKPEKSNPVDFDVSDPQLPERAFLDQVVEKLRERGFEDAINDLDGKRFYDSNRPIVVSMQKQGWKAILTMTKPNYEFLRCTLWISDLSDLYGNSYFEFKENRFYCDWSSDCVEDGSGLDCPSAEFFVQHAFDHVGL